MKPLGEKAAAGDLAPLARELELLRGRVDRSELALHLVRRESPPILLAALKVPCLAEKAIVFLYCEQNLLSQLQVLELVRTLGLDRAYLERRVRDNGRVL